MLSKISRWVFSIIGATLLLAVSGPTRIMSMEQPEHVTAQKIMPYDELIKLSEQAIEEEFNALLFEKLSSQFNVDGSQQIFKDYLSLVQQIKTDKPILEEIKNKMADIIPLTMFSSGDFKELQKNYLMKCGK